MKSSTVTPENTASEARQPPRAPAMGTARPDESAAPPVIPVV